MRWGRRESIICLINYFYETLTSSKRYLERRWRKNTSPRKTEDFRPVPTGQCLRQAVIRRCICLGTNLPTKWATSSLRGADRTLSTQTTANTKTGIGLPPKLMALISKTDRPIPKICISPRNTRYTRGGQPLPRWLRIRTLWEKGKNVVHLRRRPFLCQLVTRKTLSISDYSIP